MFRKFDNRTPAFPGCGTSSSSSDSAAKNSHKQASTVPLTAEQRAKAAVMGALVADAASMGLHW